MGLECEWRRDFAWHEETTSLGKSCISTKPKIRERREAVDYHNVPASIASSVFVHHRYTKIENHALKRDTELDIYNSTPALQSEQHALQ
jgi:hypothetical protein